MRITALTLPQKLQRLHALRAQRVTLSEEIKALEVSVDAERSGVTAARRGTKRDPADFVDVTPLPQPAREQNLQLWGNARGDSL